MPEFMPGLELSRLFYLEAVRPILDRSFPGLPHAAGRLDTGSEVLGFDTARSMDHWWGPRVQLFVDWFISRDVCAFIAFVRFAAPGRGRCAPRPRVAAALASSLRAPLPGRPPAACVPKRCPPAGNEYERWRGTHVCAPALWD